MKNLDVIDATKIRRQSLKCLEKNQLSCKAFLSKFAAPLFLSSNSFVAESMQEFEQSVSH